MNNGMTNMHILIYMNNDMTNMHILIYMNNGMTNMHILMTIALLAYSTDFPSPSPKDCNNLDYFTLTPNSSINAITLAHVSG